MAKTVFFTVLRWSEKVSGKKTHCQIILDLLGKSGRAIVLELDEFNPHEDADEIKDFVALFEPSPEKFSGRCRIVDEKTKGLPTWARGARSRVLIGAKALNSSSNMISCVEHLLAAFPPLPASVVRESVLIKNKKTGRLASRLWAMLKDGFLNRQH